MRKHYNIGFLLTAEHSCYNAAFGLANALQERGHNVMFLVNEGSVFVEYVNSNGFQAVKISPVLESPAVIRKHLHRFRLWKRLTEHGPSVLLKQRRLTDLIEKNSLEICFLDDVRGDVNLYSVALAKMKVPTLLVSYTFASTFQPEYPPVFSSMIPPDNAESNIGYRIIFTILWIWAISTKGRAYSYDCVDYMKQSFKKLLDQIRDIGFERELRLFGWKSTWSEWKRRPLIPQVVFGHHRLDWPAIALNPGRYYFGTSDLWRKNFDFDWSTFESNKPIIYCNISTTGGFGSGRVSISKGQKETGDVAKKKTRMAKRYLDVILECFSQRKDWQLIVACGPFYEALRNGIYPPNIHIFERIPQLAILEKADLAITWGGAGTVRECINFGVPMLIFPAWTDQFGNAARVLARNVGLRGNILEVTPEQMTEMVEQILTDELIHTSVNEIQRQCDAKNEILGFVDFVKCHTALEL